MDTEEKHGSRVPGFVFATIFLIGSCLMSDNWYQLAFAVSISSLFFLSAWMGWDGEPTKEHYNLSQDISRRNTMAYGDPSCYTSSDYRRRHDY